MRSGYGIDVPHNMADRFNAAMDVYGFSYVERKKKARAERACRGAAGCAHARIHE
jgi:hypothetical protein